MNRILLFLTALLVAGCGGNVAINRAHVRYVNLVPDGPQLDYYLDGSRILHGAAFLSASGYTLIDSGSRTFDITQLSHSEIKASVTTTVQDAVPYSVIAIGRANPTGSEPGYQLVTLQEETAIPPNGLARVRFFNGAPSSQPLDWYLTMGDDFATRLPDFSANAYGTNTDYLWFQVGSWRLRATLAGTKTVVLDTNVVFSGKTIYTILARDSLNGGAPIQVASMVDGG